MVSDLDSKFSDTTVHKGGKMSTIISVQPTKKLQPKGL